MTRPPCEARTSGLDWTGPNGTGATVVVECQRETGHQDPEPYHRAEVRVGTATVVVTWPAEPEGMTRPPVG